jgi:hypothetical protein
MSLIEIRRDRKQGAAAGARPPRLWKMLLALAVILYLLWYLERVT